MTGNNIQMRSPVFSIITVTFNAAHVLEKTILSVINQTYYNIEFIIIDGASKGLQLQTEKNL